MTSLTDGLLYRFAQICKALIEAGIGASDFASFFLPRLAPLAYDPVVNVRIAASRTIGTIYTNGNSIIYNNNIKDMKPTKCLL